MRPIPILALVALSACGTGFDLSGLVDPADAARRGAVEATVKSQHPQILDNIAAGGGPALTAAFDAANVPAPDRPARTTQLQGDLGLYASNPGALTAAIAAWGRRA